MKNLLHLWMVLFLFTISTAGAPASENLEPLKQEALNEVESMSTLTRQMVDMIFSFSELGFQEIETSAYITAILRENGFEVTDGISGMPTAWVARWGRGHPVIAFCQNGAKRIRLWPKLCSGSSATPTFEACPQSCLRPLPPRRAPIWVAARTTLATYRGRFQRSPSTSPPTSPTFRVITGQTPWQWPRRLLTRAQLPEPRSWP